MVEWIGPCIPRGNASHAPLGRVEGDHILHGRDTRMPYEALAEQDSSKASSRKQTI